MFFLGNFCALLASFREPDRNRLFAALDSSSFATFAGFQSTLFAPAHCALHTLAGAFTVLSSARSRSRSLLCWHSIILRSWLNASMSRLTLLRKFYDS